MAKIKPGMRVRFDPYEDMHSAGCSYLACELKGKVVQVNADHKWFLVEADDKIDGRTFRVGYKFDDFYGDHKKVFIVKE